MANRLRVLHIVNNLHIGGTTSVLIKLLQETPSSNQFEYLVLNLSGKCDDSVLSEINQIGIKIYNFNFNFSEKFSSVSYLYRALFLSNLFGSNKSVIQLIVDLRPDIIHAHTLPSELNIGKVVKRKLKCKLVYTDHSARVNKNEISLVSAFLLKIAFKKFYQNYNVIAVSESVKRYINLLHLDKVILQLSVINNKISQKEFQIDNTAKKIITIIYISRLSASKGHIDLIKAWERLPKLNLCLKLIGPDQMNGMLQNVCDQMSFNNEIIFVGATNKIDDHLKSADIGVFPSHKEGLPIALLEQMQVGLPCIVSNIQEITDIVTDMENAIVFECGNDLDLAEKIKLLVDDFDLRIKLGKNASKLVLDKYCDANNSFKKEYEKFYEIAKY